MFAKTLLLLALFAFQMTAQVDRATLSGTVTDSSGAVIPGATLEVISQDTGLRRQVQTGANGAYTFSQLPIGSYTVTLTHTGFRTVTTKDVRLGVGDNRALNLEMSLSSVDTTVNVEATAETLDTNSP